MIRGREDKTQRTRARTAVYPTRRASRDAEDEQMVLQFENWALPASCIVFHLVKSRSNLHPDSPERTEPGYDRSTNVFNLGFIVKKDEDPPTVALLSEMWFYNRLRR